MNAIDYALNTIQNSDISDYVLQLAFVNPNVNILGNNWYNYVNQTTIEQGIREKVIHRTVLPDCKLNGGTTEFIDLTGSRMRDLGNGYIEVNVPDWLTGGRKIAQVVEVYLGSMTSSTGMLGLGVAQSDNCGQGSVTDLTQGLIDSLSSNSNIPPTFTNVQMTGNNSFVIANLNSGAFSMTAKCILEYDDFLTSLNPRSLRYFGTLCNWATKAFIFRTCRHPTSEAIKRSGVNVDTLKDEIDEFRDAWQNYVEYRDGTWIKVMTYSDTQQVVDSIRMSTIRRT